jgi:hypothetical protein
MRFLRQGEDDASIRSYGQGPMQLALLSAAAYGGDQKTVDVDKQQPTLALTGTGDALSPAAPNT